MGKIRERTVDKVALLQGSLDLLVLGILFGGSNHGFGIARRLREVSGEWLRVDEGSLYPCLYRLEERGYIQSEVLPSENNRRARFYSTTKSGKEEFRMRVDNWNRLNDVVTAVVKEGSAEWEWPAK